MLNKAVSLESNIELPFSERPFKEGVKEKGHQVEGQQEGREMLLAVPKVEGESPPYCEGETITGAMTL